MMRGIIASVVFWTATAAWGFFGWLGACAALAAWMWAISKKEVS